MSWRAGQAVAKAKSSAAGSNSQAVAVVGSSSEPPRKKGRGAGGAAGAEGAGDRRRRRDEDAMQTQIDEITKSMQTLGRASLSSLQECRATKGALFSTYLGPSSKGFVQAAVEAGTAYFAAAKEGGVEGPPHSHIGAAFLEQIAKSSDAMMTYPEAEGDQRPSSSTSTRR